MPNPTRLAAARLALATAHLKLAQSNVDAAHNAPRRRRKTATSQPATGEIDAVVTWGSWLRDDAAGEEGPAIGFRPLAGPVQDVTLIADISGDNAGPDLAPGDTVRLKRVGHRRHQIIRVVRRASARRPIDWLVGWRGGALPNIHAVCGA